MKKYYLSINGVKVQVEGLHVAESLGIFDNKFILNFELPFNKNDKSIEQYLVTLYNKYRDYVCRKADVCFDCDVLEGDIVVGKLHNVITVYRDLQFKYNMVFDHYTNKRVIDCSPTKRSQTKELFEDSISLNILAGNINSDINIEQTLS